MSPSAIKFSASYGGAGVNEYFAPCSIRLAIKGEADCVPLHEELSNVRARRVERAMHSDCRVLRRAITTIARSKVANCRVRITSIE